MIRPLKIGWLMCCFSVALLLVHPLFIETATACGPCTDPHTGSWSGVGNGWCGRCGDRTYTFSSGSCADTDSSACTDSTKAATYTVPYDSEPVGTIAYVLCVAARVVCLAALVAGDAIVCTPVCYTAGVWTGGTACYACITGVAAAGFMACDCGFDECKEWCTSGTPYYSGSVPTC